MAQILEIKKYENEYLAKIDQYFKPKSLEIDIQYLPDNALFKEIRYKKVVIQFLSFIEKVNV